LDALIFGPQISTMPVRSFCDEPRVGWESGWIMVFEHIEKLKSELTDKFVIVDGERPELGRFRGHTGTVKTVNMNGKALVEFEGDNNIGWFDIDLDFLKVIDKPLEKPEPAAKKKGAEPTAKASTPAAKGAAPAKKPAAKMSMEEMLAAARGGAKPASSQEKASASPSAPSASKPAAGKPAAKMSMDEILAAARSGAKPGTTKEEKAPASPPAPSAEKPAGKLSVEEILAAARRDKSPTAGAAPKATSAPPAAKVDPKKMSVADILAAARGNQPSDATAPSASTDDVSPQADVEAEVSEPTTDEPSVAAPAVDAQPAEKSGGIERKKFDSIEEILAYCRQTDSN